MPSLPDVVSRVIEIDEGEIEVVLSQGVKRFLGRTDEMTSMTLSFHQQAQCLADIGLVVGNEDVRRWCGGLHRRPFLPASV